MRYFIKKFLQLFIGLPILTILGIFTLDFKLIGDVWSETFDWRGFNC